MLSTISGIDHVMIVVRDLETTARQWEDAGFTLSPCGLHSAAMGSANHTIVLGDDYIELLGVVSPQPLNEGVRAFLEKREGFARTAFTTTDAASCAVAIRAMGIVPVGPTDFSRPVLLADGTETEARFTVIQWPEQTAPGGMRIFACQHHTRDAVWIPELRNHDNGAKRLRRVLIATPEPAAAAADMARLIDSAVQQDGARYRVPTGLGRADFEFATRAAYSEAYGVEAEGLPEEGGAGLVVVVEAARPPTQLSGCVIIFAVA